jgi:hypothetical protein
MRTHLKSVFSPSRHSSNKARRRTTTGRLVETLEHRLLLSVSATPSPLVASAALHAAVIQDSVAPATDTAPVITSANNADIFAGVGGTFTVISQASPVASWMETGALPTGVTFVDNNDGTATFTVAPTAAAATINLTLTATNGVAPDATQSFTLNIVQTTAITVASLDDSGQGTLRQAIIDANMSGGTTLIKFASGLKGTVNLLSALPDLATNIIIVGTGVTVDGSKADASVFTVDLGTTCEFLNTTITGGDGATGGGIDNTGTLAVVNSTIMDNSSGEGGGIFSSGSLTVTDSTLSRNSVSEDGNGGGGIFSSGDATVIDSTLSQNDGGAGIDGGGGGIASQGTGSLSVINSTIASNSADYGAGISNSGSTLTVVDSTVVQNTTVSDDGGITTFSTPAATINGTIVARNSAPDISSAGPGGIVGSNDLIGDGSDMVLADNPIANLTNSLRGTPTHPLNPQLSPLANNGGPTETMAEQANSPGIGQGASFRVLDASNGDITATDQRGVVRPLSGVDIGAFQLPPTGAAKKLLIVPVVSTIVAGGTLGTTTTPGTFVVKLINSKGQIDTSNTSSVTINVDNSAGVAVGSPVTVQAVAGIATFSGLSETLAGSFTLVATDANLTPGKSNKFTVTPDTATAKLVLTHQPAATVVGAPLATNLIVEIQDQYDNVITTNKSKVTLTKTSGPGTLGGTTTVTASKGVATFSKAFLSTAGTYSLSATDSSLTSNSSVEFAQTITQGVTTIAAPHTAASYAANRAITLSGTFKSSAPTSIPFTGTASIVAQNSDVLGTAVLSANGAVKFVLTSLPANTYVCTITYPGDTNHTAVTSSTFNIVVKSA